MPIRPSPPRSRKARTAAPCESSVWCAAAIAGGQSRQPGRLDAVCVAEEGRDPGLVVRDPVVDDVAEPVEDDLRVLGEPFDDVSRGPAALRPAAPGGGPSGRASPAARCRARAGPRRAGGRSRGPSVRRAASVRLDARPGDREAVAPEPERPHQVEVVAPAEVVLAGRVARVAVLDLSGRRAEAVPDRLAAAVGVVAPSIWNAAVAAPNTKSDGNLHPFTAPCMIPPMIWRPRTRKTKSSGRIEMNVPVRTSAKSST